jgi:hypothetical protein
MYSIILRTTIILSIFLLVISCASSSKNGLSKPFFKGWVKKSIEIQNDLKDVKFVRLVLKNEDGNNENNKYFGKYLNKVFTNRLKKHGFLVTTRDETEGITIFIRYDFKDLCGRYSFGGIGPGHRRCIGGDLSGNIAIHYKDTLIYENTYRGRYLPRSTKNPNRFFWTLSRSGVYRVFGSLVYHAYLGKNNDSSSDKFIEMICRSNRFNSLSNGIVFDFGTGLIWPAKDNGAGIRYLDAKKYAEDLILAGHTNWRLPTKSEIQSISTRRYRKFNRNQVACRTGTKCIQLSKCCLWIDSGTQYESYNYYDFRYNRDFKVRDHEIQEGNYWIETQRDGSDVTKHGRVLPVTYLSIKD